MLKPYLKASKIHTKKPAKIIAAAAEFQAAQKISEAADILSKNDTSIKLRYLQTLSEISNEKTSTIVFPIEFMEKLGLKK